MILGTTPLAFSVASCASKKMVTPTNTLNQMPKISLAQWSLHRHLMAGQLDPRDFAKTAKLEYGIGAIEYVNQFYTDQVKDQSFWKEMKRRATDAGVESLLIMVDDEGELGDADDQKRQTAVENHFKWVDAANILGCHSIRVNAFGARERSAYKNAIIDGMGRLSEYAGKENINVIIENHGLYSSDASLIVEIIKQVNKPNFGSFPDFGNWCLNEKWGSTQDGKCTEAYDIYKGVSQLLPYAKAVSAKSYDFDKNGYETTMDYSRLLKAVKESGYKGYIGVEYEGHRLSEPEGIRATKLLIEKVWSELDSTF